MGPLFSIAMASISSFERMSTFHIDQLLWSFWSQAGPCHQKSFPFSILTVQPLDLIFNGFWSVDTYQNSMPLFDRISSFFLRTNGVRSFSDFNQCKIHSGSVHKVFQWISSCVMKLILLVPIGQLVVQVKLMFPSVAQSLIWWI